MPSNRKQLKSIDTNPFFAYIRIVSVFYTNFTKSLLIQLTNVDLGISRRLKKTLKPSHHTVKEAMSHTSAPLGRSKVRSSFEYLLPATSRPSLPPLVEII